jgi:hypothetical protein
MSDETTKAKNLISATKNARKATLPAPPGLVAGGGSGGVMFMPTAEQLEAKGIPKNVAETWGGRALTMLTTDVNGNTLSRSLQFASAFNTVPEDVQQAVYTISGYNDKSLGKTADERAAAILLGLTDNKMQLGKINIPELAGQVNDLSQATLDNRIIKNEMYPTLQNETATEEYTAESTVYADLSTWGINSPEIDQLVNSLAAEGFKDPNLILDQVRQTNAYKAAFPGLEQYNSSPGAYHMSETQYMTYTQSITDAANNVGAPMPTAAEIGKLLTGHVSASEYAQRVNDIYTAVQNADQNVKNILQQQYGIGPSQLMNYYINPKVALSTMQRQVASADITDYASRVGLTGLTTQDATQLAGMAKLASTAGNQGLGYGVSQVESSLLNASKDVALTKSNPGQNTPTLSTNTLIGSQLAGFGGTNQVAAAR